MRGLDVAQKIGVIAIGDDICWLAERKVAFQASCETVRDCDDCGSSPDNVDFQRALAGDK